MLTWIIQTGEPLHCDPGVPRPMRAMNLADSLIDRGHKVVIWSSAFYHQEKRHRCREFKSISINDALTINLIPSPGYSKNISLKRLFDHFIMARNLYHLFVSGQFQKPDVAFVGFPPIETAAVAIRWLKVNRIPSVVDVKDQWPSIFVDALPQKLRTFGRILFAPYFSYARRALSEATAFSGISQGFLNWAAQLAGRDLREYDHILSLTTREIFVSDNKLNEARVWWNQRGVDLASKRNFCFVGSLSQAFDFSGIRDAAKRFQDQGANCQFIICGDGGAAPQVKAMMAGLNNVLFPGWIDFPKIVVLAQHSVAALAPYKSSADFKQSIPNKIIDSLALGCPILTSLEGDVQKLVESYGVGFVCRDGISMSWYDCASKLLNDVRLASEMSCKARSLYVDLYSFDKVYGGMCRVLEELAAVDLLHLSRSE